MADAVAMNTELTETGQRQSELHGILVFLKDLIDQQGFPMMAESIAMQNCMPSTDLAVVTKLKKAGFYHLGEGFHE